VATPRADLSEEQQETVVTIGRLLGAGDEVGVEQALSLLEALGDVDVARALAVGIAVEDGVVVLDAQTLREVRRSERGGAALRLAKVAGVLEEVETLSHAVYQEHASLSTSSVSLRVFEGLPKLRALKLRDRTAAELAELEGCHALESLEVSGSRGAKAETLTIPASVAARLRALRLCHLAFAGDLDLRSCAALESLEIIGCIDRFEPILDASTSRLRFFEVVGARHLASLAFLEGIASLEEVAVEGCEALMSVESTCWRGVRKARLGDLRRLGSIAPLCAPETAIRQLELVELPSLKSLEPIAGMRGVEVIDIRNCKVTSLGAKPWPATLREVTLADCTMLADLSALSGARNLDNLTVGGCNVARMPEIVDVGEVDASDCAALRDVSALASCRYLHTLSLDGCRTFDDVHSLTMLRNLETLDLRGTAITNIAPLAALTSLRRLRTPRVSAEALAALRQALPNCRCV
jgi:hypothetical protein